MDDQQALTIVSALANGANPQTGELFADNSPYQSPDVIRALFAAQRALEAKLHPKLHVERRAPTGSRASEPSTPEKRASDQGANAGSNAGKPWSTEEDQQLLKEFDADKPIADIAHAHGRTAAGIRARLEKHGKLEPSGNTRWAQSGQKQAAPASSHRAARKDS